MASDHYQVLGVPPDADPTVIKRRYRLLVRQNHPDAVAPNERQAAHERMLLINAAWTTLSDPSERARYDKSRQPVFVPRNNENHDQNGNGNNAPAPGVRTRVDGWVGGSAANRASANRSGAARAASARTSSGPRHASDAASSTRNRASGSTSRVGNPRTRLLTMVFEAAELYFFHGRADEAVKMCREVLVQDPTNGEAAALLGDIFVEQGHRQLALEMYEKAVRNQPENGLYRQKWEGLKMSGVEKR
jgi:tetratricopeptide (TPR) repeat protein